jgi:mono/diheme cytochrome c family protein
MLSRQVAGPFDLEPWNRWMNLRILPLLLLALPALGQQSPQVSYVGASRWTLLLRADGKQYEIDLVAQTVHEAGAPGPKTSLSASAAADLFVQNCASCHGSDGRGNRTIGTPNFTDASVQKSLGDQDVLSTIRNGKGGRMPAWSSRLTDAQISVLASYIRSFATGGNSTSADSQPAATPGVYQPGDDVLVSLPTGRAVEEHAVIVDFTHRFAYDSAFTGTGRGEELLGLDNFSLSSFGFRYGVTDKFSVQIYRSPSFIGRSIQLMAGYNLLDERHGDPLNVAVRASIEGQNNFRKNFTENLEAILSRSLTSYAQLYFVPTVSFNDRRLVQGGLRSAEIPDLPGINAFSVGAGLAVDIRPTLALLAEVIPTVVNGDQLGIHRPAFSFGIQKKIYRHAFTFAFTNSPGTTVSQRAGTRATFLNDPNADTPAKVFIGFDITRQIH